MKASHLLGRTYRAALFALLLATALPAAAETISVTAPGTLDRQGATYVLAQDVSAPGTAFYIVGRGITFDLNGHTITYNAQPSATPVYGICVGTPTQWLNMDDTGLVIKNGSITQGAGASGFSDALYFRYTNPRNTELTGLHLTVQGDSAHVIAISGGKGFSIHDNVFTSNVATIQTRYHYDGYLIDMGSVTGAVISSNTMTGGHGGVVLVTCSDVEISANDISHRCLAGNGYGVLLWNPTGVRIFGNSIHSEDGLGILIDNNWQNVEVYNNTIDVKMRPKDEGQTVWGMKCRSWVTSTTAHGLDVHDNVIRVTTGDAYLPYAAGIGIYSARPAIDARFHNNDITAITTSPAKAAEGIRVAGDEASDTGTLVYDNTITSNNVNIGFSSEDGHGANGIIFTSNTLVKGDNPLNYHTIRMGYWRCASEGQTFIDTRTGSGASVHDVLLEGSDPPGVYDYSMLVKWYLDVAVTDAAGAPVAGATVTAVDQAGNTEVAALTDSLGQARLTLTQYVRSGTTYPPTSVYQQATPHLIRVAKPGYADSSQSVTMDASKSLAVTLAPSDEGASPELSLTMTVDKPTAVPGEAVTYTIAFTNSTTGALSSAVVTSSVPAEVQYVPGSTRLGGVTVTPDPYTAGQIAVPVGTLAPGAGGVVTYQAVVK
jgi:uncharacterized repeat protein (TIGR01451 family)